MLENVHVIDHPLLNHKLTLMRKKSTSTSLFRSLMKEIGILLMYEVSKDFKLKDENIETPITSCSMPVLENENIVVVPIMRAGMGLLDAVLEILPVAKVGHVGIYRNHESNSTIEYYFKVPNGLDRAQLIVLDPMIATGNSARAAITRLKSNNPTNIKLVSILSTKQGLSEISAHHPEVKIFTLSIDEKLNENGYIFPGIGDAGDRLFGTL